MSNFFDNIHQKQRATGNRTSLLILCASFEAFCKQVTALINVTDKDPFIKNPYKNMKCRVTQRKYSYSDKAWTSQLIYTQLISFLFYLC